MTKYGKTHEYPDAYDDVVKLLRRLEAEGLAKKHPKESRYKPTIWSKPGIKEIKRHDEVLHELDCMDLYVAYWPSQPDGLQYWDWQWQADERHAYGSYRSGGANFDGRMLYRGQWFIFEVDRGTKTLEQLEDQVKGWLALSRKEPGKYFRVIWTLQFERYGFTYPPEEKRKQVNRRARFLLDTFDRLKTGERFLVARHSEVLSDPFGPVLVSPLSPAAGKPIDSFLPRKIAS